MTTTSTLASRLAAASVAVGALATDKRNAQQGYDYISADKILERCGDALAHAGVILIPAIIAEDTQAIEVTTNRGTGVRYDAAVTFAMTLTDGETTLEFPWRGRGSDYAVPDKALYKAITSGHKYFLAKLLMVGVGNEDGEHEEAPQPQQKPQERPQPRTAQKQAAPVSSAPPSASTQATTDGDVLFMPDEPPAPRGTVTEATMKRLHALGNEVYGKQWDAKRPVLVQHVTKGVADSASALNEDEAKKLCAGLEAKRAQMRQPDAIEQPVF